MTRLLAILLLLATPAFADTKEDIQLLLSKFDETAYVSEQRTESEGFLPLTPGSKAYVSTYTVYHSGQIPDEIKSLVGKKAGAVSYFTMPKSTKEKFPERIIGEFKDLNKLQSSIDSAASSVNKSISEAAAESSKAISEAVQSSSKDVSKPLLPYLLTSAGIVGALALLGFFVATGGLKKAAEKVAKAFESGSSPSAPLQMEQEKAPAPAVAAQQSESIPPYIYKNVMFDLYWSKMDAEASFIASQMPVSAKIELAKDAILSSYFEYLRDINPKPSNILSDASYLSDKGYSHVSNEDLLKAVKEDSKAYKSLSDIRANNLGLNTIERIALERSEAGLYDFSKLGASAPRILQNQRLVDPSDDDEEALLSTLSEEDKRMLLSLYIVSTSERAAEILSQYGARDLASIWIGPANVLSKLEPLLPEAKLKMLKAYLEKTKPSRGPLMKEIVKKALEA